MLAQARRHLQDDMDAVGLTERFDESLVLMSLLLQWDEAPLYYPLNVTAPPQERPDISEADRALIAERNCLDVKLYRFAEDLFEEAIARAGDRFVDAFGEYQDRKQAWYEKHGLPIT